MYNCQKKKKKVNNVNKNSIGNEEMATNANLSILYFYKINTLALLCLNPHTDVWERLAKLWRYNCEEISGLTKPLYYERAAKSLSNQAVLSINHISHPTGHSFIAAADTSCWKVKSEALYLDYVAFWCFSLRRPCKRRTYPRTHTQSVKKAPPSKGQGTRQTTNSHNRDC